MLDGARHQQSKLNKSDSHRTITKEHLMFSYTFIIIAIIALIFLVGYLKELNAEEKAIVVGRTINATKYGATMAIKATRSTAKATFQAGQIAGLEMALNGQATITAMDTHNKDVASKGGAVKMSVQDFDKLCADLGVADLNTNMAKTIETKREELATVRASRVVA